MGYVEGSIEYKIEKIYTCLFDLKSFKNLVIECKNKEIIDHMKFYTQGGCLGAGFGWSETNHTIVDIDKRGIYFNNDETKIYSFSKIADMLINQYGRYQQLSLF